jgi:hypothetical protein
MKAGAIGTHKTEAEIEPHSCFQRDKTTGSGCCGHIILGVFGHHEYPAVSIYPFSDNQIEYMRCYRTFSPGGSS